MRSHYFIASLVLIPFCAYAQANPDAKTRLSYTQPVNEFTTIKSYSNDVKPLSALSNTARTTDYPTQIIRTQGDLEGMELDCDQVNATIENTLIKHINKEQFAYNTLVACNYDPDTHYATQYLINSYFDPLNDKAIEDLKTYIAEYNGSDLMGTKMQIESAKGVIIALNIAAGTKKNPEHPPFMQYRQDHSNYFFKSNYEMKNVLLDDVYQNFYSDDPEKILPFLDRWLFPKAGTSYAAVLRDANYVELQPERIFLMEKTGDIFISKLRYYYTHSCLGHSNHRCLKS